MTTSTTSGTAAFNLDLTEIVEEAFERVGSELRTGYDLRTARRSLNLLFADWANRGVNMWTFEQNTITLVTGQPTYALPDDTVDLLDHVIRTSANVPTNQADLTITRISVSTYATIPNKLIQGRPIQVWINRQTVFAPAVSTTTLAGSISSSDTTITVVDASGLPPVGFVNIGSETILYQNVGTSLTSNANQLLNCYRGMNGTTAASHSAGDALYRNYLPSLNIWPTGNPGTQYNLIYYRMRRMQDAGSGTYDQDIPFRFLECMVAGLAYKMSLKLPDMDPNRIAMLKADYEQQFDLAAQEDREKATVRFVPRNLFYYR